MLTGLDGVGARRSPYPVPMRSHFPELAETGRGSPELWEQVSPDGINAAQARAAPARLPCRQSPQHSSADECPRRIETVPQDQELNSSAVEATSTPREYGC